jgi:hypothetical protein
VKTAQKLLNSYFETSPLTAQRQKKLEDALGYFVLSSNIEFNIVEDYYFLR